MDKNLSFVLKMDETLGVMSDAEVVKLLRAVAAVFTKACTDAGIPKSKITAVKTKLNDAGRRSAPWQPVSSRVPGRPQDGSDGNRINRWLLPEDHKFYATELNATLVQIRYYFQILSMKGAPSIEHNILKDRYQWLMPNQIAPGEYKDPITLLDVDFNDFVYHPGNYQSGHIYPLDRGGRHVPENTFLMSKRSNALQGNQTLPELLDYIEGILRRHGRL